MLNTNLFHTRKAKKQLQNSQRCPTELMEEIWMLIFEYWCWNIEGMSLCFAHNPGNFARTRTLAPSRVWLSAEAARGLGTLLQGYLDTTSTHDFKFTAYGVSGGVMDIDAVASDTDNILSTATCDLLTEAGDATYVGAVMLGDASNNQGTTGVTASETSPSSEVSAHHLWTGK
jgi:hypothetical protein